MATLFVAALHWGDVVGAFLTPTTVLRAPGFNAASTANNVDQVQIAG